MDVGLQEVLPNLGNSLDGTGFLFGAGTSFEAGYPLMHTLTRQVVAGLGSEHRALLEEALSAASLEYDDWSATPNVEQLSDIVIAHLLKSSDPGFSDLELRIRALIIEIMTSVPDPNTDNHCAFFESLKRRAFGLPCCVWIFTTNYDLLFETAAARSGVIIENCFSGATERFFNPNTIGCAFGSISNKRFERSTGLTIKLIKLHGSISWVEEDGKIYERHPAAIGQSSNRVMILPKRKKVMETLSPPYDTLFTQASRVLGSECRYLASCGFSFGDEHINQNLLIPTMRANKCRLFVFSQEQPVGIDEFRSLPNFSAAFESHSIKAGQDSHDLTTAWKFSEFVRLFS